MWPEKAVKKFPTHTPGSLGEREKDEHTATTGGTAVAEQNSCSRLSINSGLMYIKIVDHGGGACSTTTSRP